MINKKQDDVAVSLLLDDKVIQDFIQKMIEELSDLDKDKTNTYKILVNVMEFVEKLKKVENKKDLVIQIYENLLEELNLDMTDAELLNESIEIVISLTKGKIDINQITKCTANCVPKIIPCFPILYKKIKKCNCNCNRKKK